MKASLRSHAKSEARSAMPKLRFGASKPTSSRRLVPREGTYTRHLKRVHGSLDHRGVALVVRFSIVVIVVIFVFFLVVIAIGITRWHHVSRFDRPAGRALGDVCGHVSPLSDLELGSRHASY
jgi:hypothetical protein